MPSYDRDDEGVKLYARNRNEVINSILPTDRWPDRENALGPQAISKDVHRSPTRTMARLVSNSRIHV